jgi:peptidoglycan/LPS O-acetylase OafA/YrhL
MTLAAVSPTYAGYRSCKRFGSLDGLRAISILAVIWHHTQPVRFAGSTLSYIGAQGVTLFFAISGFLISTLMLREYERNGRIDLLAFYMRRSLRIFPLYFTVLGIYVLAVLLLERDTEPGKAFFANLPYFATYTSNLFVELRERVIFYFAWSLAAEEQFSSVAPSTGAGCLCRPGCCAIDRDPCCLHRAAGCRHGAAFQGSDRHRQWCADCLRSPYAARV